MKTTKQYFEMTARIIKARIQLYESSTEFFNHHKIAVLKEIAKDFIQEFESNNQFFNEDRFLKACGIK